MTIRAVLFDLYGTLIDIETDESMDEIYRVLTGYLMYQGIPLNAGDVRERYWRIADECLKEGGEAFPEIDVELVWYRLLIWNGMKTGQATRRLSRTLAQVFRAISRKRFGLFPHALEVLHTTRGSHRTGLVSDAQACYAEPEMAVLGLDGCFDTVILSSRRGLRKPDVRLFAEALTVLTVEPAEAVYVGNDPYRDIFGACHAGMKTVLVRGKGEMKGEVTAKPDAAVETIAELPAAIEAL